MYYVVYDHEEEDFYIRYYNDTAYRVLTSVDDPIVDIIAGPYTTFEEAKTDNGAALKAYLYMGVA